MSETILTTLQNKIGQILNTNAMDVHSCRKLYETYLEKYSKNCEILVSLYIAYTTNMDIRYLNIDWILCFHIV